MGRGPGIGEGGVNVHAGGEGAGEGIWGGWVKVMVGKGEEDCLNRFARECSAVRGGGGEGG